MQKLACTKAKKPQIKVTSEVLNMEIAEIADVKVARDGEASKENPSSSAHPVSITCKVRLPMFIPVVQSLVRHDKEEKAIESYTVSRKRTTSSQITKKIKR